MVKSNQSRQRISVRSAAGNSENGSCVRTLMNGLHVPPSKASSVHELANWTRSPNRLSTISVETTVPSANVVRSLTILRWLSSSPSSGLWYSAQISVSPMSFQDFRRGCPCAANEPIC